jgi:uncharacterized membrane protein
MLIVVVLLLVVSVAALIAAVIIGTPAPAHPKHGTFGIDGIDGSFLAWACVGLCAVGLLLLIIDSKREKSKPAEHEEQDHTAGDEFGEHEVERDRAREN